MISIFFLNFSIHLIKFLCKYIIYHLKVCSALLKNIQIYWHIDVFFQFNYFFPKPVLPHGNRTPTCTALTDVRMAGTQSLGYDKVVLTVDVVTTSVVFSLAETVIPVVSDSKLSCDNSDKSMLPCDVSRGFRIRVRDFRSKIINI